MSENAETLPKKRGRPSGSGGPTTAQTEAVCKAIREGNYFETACLIAGVRLSTAYGWRQRGEGSHPTREKLDNYADFAEAVNEADAHAENFLLEKMQEAGEGDWKMYATVLERRFRDRWSRSMNHQKMLEKMIEERLASLTSGAGREGATSAFAP